MARKEQQYLTAIKIESGIITLIDSNGFLKQYRQRNITNIPEDEKSRLIESELLDSNWNQYPELPGNISLSFEDPYLWGKAETAYKIPMLLP